jgi:hypothetical protein
VNSRKYYVYCLVNSFDGLPFYVGAGSGKRDVQHVQRSGWKCYDGWPLYEKIREIINAGGTVTAHRLAAGLTRRESFALEKEAISRIGRTLLTNRTAGGQGFTGTHSLAARAKMSAWKKGRQPWNTGKKLGPRTPRAKARWLRLTKGKLGHVRGFEHRIDTRQKLKQSHEGKPALNAGMKLQGAKLQSFREKLFSHRGQPVIRLRDGKEFPSATKASIALGYNKGLVGNAINIGIRAAGSHWRFMTAAEAARYKAGDSHGG